MGNPPQGSRTAAPGLPRLSDAAYQGFAIVHWTLTVRDRGTGWLTPGFAAQFRWILLHGCARYAVACPVYCLMPDHVHLLIHGWDRQADQRRFLRFLRLHSNALLADTENRWQPQAHDHVLRAREKDRFAFEDLAHYIMQNPVRAGLVEEAKDWPHLGVVIPGYPELNLWTHDYWQRYWRLMNSKANGEHETRQP